MRLHCTAQMSFSARTPTAKIDHHWSQPRRIHWLTLYVRGSKGSIPHDEVGVSNCVQLLDYMKQDISLLVGKLTRRFVNPFLLLETSSACLIPFRIMSNRGKAEFDKIRICSRLLTVALEEAPQFGVDEEFEYPSPPSWYLPP